RVNGVHAWVESGRCLQPLDERIWRAARDGAKSLARGRRWPGGGKMKQGRAKREDVAARIDRQPIDLLRRRILRRVALAPSVVQRHRGGGVTASGREAEVEQYVLAGRRATDVMRLQIAMDDRRIAPVEIQKGAGKRERALHQFVGVKRPPAPLESLCEVLAF